MLRDAICFKHVFVCTGYTDMRLGIDGLVAIVAGAYSLDPSEKGSVFLFCGRKADRIKALLFEGDGWLLCYKRLTGSGRFQWPRSSAEAKEITQQEFRWLMEGLAIEQKKAIKEHRPGIF